MSEPNAIGQAIRKQRQAAGLSARQLAARAGVFRNTILNNETGKTDPSAVQLLAIAKALGCSITALLGCESAGEVAKNEEDLALLETLSKALRHGVRSAFVRGAIAPSKVAELLGVPVEMAKKITAMWIDEELDV